jgi:uncharacterized repeat protein (TIGR03833 family)
VEGQYRNTISIGSKVAIVLKQDQRSGKLTEGIVAQLLTSAAFHPHGIKVKLTSGEVGRVKAILKLIEFVKVDFNFSKNI